MSEGDMRVILIEFLHPVEGWERGDRVRVTADPMVRRLIERGRVREVQDDG